MFGLASKLEVICRSCDKKMFSDFSSPTCQTSRAYDINQRFVLACKPKGLGYEQAKKFITHMEIPPPISDTAYTDKLPALAASCEKALNDHLAAVRAIVRKQYIWEGYADQNDEKVDIAVSFDGTWQKRGHTSHNGIGIAIDLLTGYVVDFEVLSNICVHCERFERAEDNMPLDKLKQSILNHK